MNFVHQGFQKLSSDYIQTDRQTDECLRNYISRYLHIVGVLVHNRQLANPKTE